MRAAPPAGVRRQQTSAGTLPLMPVAPVPRSSSKRPTVMGADHRLLWLTTCGQSIDPHSPLQAIYVRTPALCGPRSGKLGANCPSATTDVAIPTHLNMIRCIRQAGLDGQSKYSAAGRFPRRQSTSQDTHSPPLLIRSPVGPVQSTPPRQCISSWRWHPPRTASGWQVMIKAVQVRKVLTDLVMLLSWSPGCYRPPNGHLERASVAGRTVWPQA
jgi:hypothetical protein